MTLRYEISSQADADAALSYFNAFHDGFIRQVTLRSDDRFEARGVHQMSGSLDLVVVFAHYNYRDGEPPADQLVEAHFRDVREVTADFPMTPGDWAILAVRIETAPDGRLVAGIDHQRLVAGRWTIFECLRLTFAGAELVELGA